MREGEPYDKGQSKAQRDDDLYGRHHTVHVKSETGERYPRTDIYFKTAESERRQYPLLHRTQKPQALLRYMIATYTRPGEVVLDNCFGSCATGVAALETGRIFFGIEQNPEFFRTGQAWFERVAGEPGHWI
jgi:DNA modification methylase